MKYYSLKLYSFLFVSIAMVGAMANAATVSIDGTQWNIDGAVTNPGAAAEGLLMNARMVNCAFEDRNRNEFDSAENLDRFIAKIAEYKSKGVQAFTFNLQGGFPNYEGAVNSAFRPNGALRRSYMARMERVIEECGRQGMAVILGLFYQRQDQILRDADAVKRGVVNAARWIVDQGYTHVALEIANEYDHNGFDHDVISSVEGELELIRLAKKTAPNLLVSTSGLGHGKMDGALAREVDFILIHFNGTKVEDIPARVEALKKFNKPIVCNEDDKIGEEGARALRASVANGCSWGFMHKTKNQYEPFEFDGYADDPAVYDAFQEAASQTP